MDNHNKPSRCKSCGLLEMFTFSGPIADLPPCSKCGNTNWEFSAEVKRLWEMNFG